ncbi:MAG TPA: TonB-dependent receptor [Terriglobia bacterium]|nr:TonB-dependent receptor [Terriglobia bacterium]
MKKLWLVLFVAVSAAAQSTNATLSGTVVDPAGARIPNVLVTAQNVQTGVVSTNLTNDAGVYVFPSVQPGLYRLTAELQGFRKYVLNDLTVDISARMTINISLELAAAQEAIEVTAVPESLSASTASVGGVISGRKLQELPLPDRDSLGLVLTQAGVLGDNFAGTRIGALNVTRDGINVMDQYINAGTNTMIFNSIDDIDEVRVVTSPVDAEFGRGFGQIQLSTRSGTNQFHGSLYEYHRNTVLDANNWFNNLRGDPRDALIQNQFGGRLGGPIVRQRTFFYTTYEGQRRRIGEAVTSTAYTQLARQGIFRFFPDVQNSNANASVPTVDLNGNPVRPASATEDLRSISVFGRDFNRSAFDSTGTIQKLLAAMPLPNDFRHGDGLNSAGYTWKRRRADDFDHYALKIDHLINDRHRINFSFIREHYESINGFLPQPFPNSPGGTVTSPGTFFSLVATSTLSPTFLNEFHAGTQRVSVRFNAPWESAGGRALLPNISAYQYVPVLGFVTSPVANDNDPQGRIAPLYVFGDSLHWIRGKHEVKVGGETRFPSSNSFSSGNVIPRVQFGVGNDLLGIIGVDSTSIPGLGPNEDAAQSLLTDLSGSVDNVFQTFNATGHPPAFQQGVSRQRTWRQREFSLFLQDDFKVKPGLTLNLGLRYEFYGVPWEAQGQAAGLVGGSGGIFGISGTSFADMYQPGRNRGSLTQVQLVGKGSPNPNVSLYATNSTNFAPVVGLSWSIPYFGKDKTILHAGYSVSYERNAFVLTDNVSGDEPGLSSDTEFTSENFLNLTNIRLPLAPIGAPLDTVPLTDRVQTAWSFDNNLRTPYTQNWNLTIQRELPGGFTLDVRYVGTKGTKLIRTVNVNEINIFENGILDAFKATQAGGTAPLFDRLLNGLNLGSGGVPTQASGSASLRAFSTTRQYLANNDVGAFAGFMNEAIVGSERGALPRRAGFPENWIVVNPQFASAEFAGNFANSTYHALQLNANKRFGKGWTLLSNYTWSRALGEEVGEGVSNSIGGQALLRSYRNGRNRHIDKQLLDLHRTQVFRNSGIWELPFGHDRRFLNGSRSLVARLVEGWQIGAIFNVFSGDPIGLSTQVTSFNQTIRNTPTLVGQLPKNTGQVRRVNDGVIYLGDLKQVSDPAIANLTPSQRLNAASSLKAIADSSGKIIAVNPMPGTLGSLSQTYLQGPGSFRFDANLIKRIRIRENKELLVRGDLINALNSPQFGDPTTDINDPNFGRITQADDGRIIVLSMRINF